MTVAFAGMQRSSPATTRRRPWPLAQVSARASELASPLEGCRRASRRLDPAAFEACSAWSVAAPMSPSAHVASPSKVVPGQRAGDHPAVRRGRRLRRQLDRFGRIAPGRPALRAHMGRTSSRARPSRRLQRRRGLCGTGVGWGCGDACKRHRCRCAASTEPWSAASSRSMTSERIDQMSARLRGSSASRAAGRHDQACPAAAQWLAGLVKRKQGAVPRLLPGAVGAAGLVDRDARQPDAPEHRRALQLDDPRRLADELVGRGRRQRHLRARPRP